MPLSDVGEPNVVTETLAGLVAGIATERGSPAIARQVVVTHKPGQRAALLLQLVEPIVLTGSDGRLVDHLYAKVFSEVDRGARSMQTLQLLWDQTRCADPSFGLPQPLAWSPEPSILVIGSVPGRALAEVFDSAGGPSRWAAVGRWMARLHCSEPPLPRRYDLDGEVLTLRRWSGEVAATRAPAVLVERYEALIDRAVEMATSIDLTQPMTGVIHRDLHQEHLIIDGVDRVGAVDLDEARLGDPHVDLGHLYAHLALAAVPDRSIAMVFEAWSAAADRPIDERSLGLATALAGLKIARQRTTGFGVAPQPIGDDRWPAAMRALDLAASALRGDTIGARP